MRVAARWLTPQRSGLMSASAPIPPLVSPTTGETVSWETDGSISYARRACSHHDLIGCCVASDAVPHPAVKGGISYTWVAEYRMECGALDSLSPGSDFRGQVLGEADADAPAALGRAFQGGMSTAHSPQPGLVTLPVITGADAGCGVRVFTAAGDDPTGAGAGLSPARAWLAAAEFWRVHGHPGAPSLIISDGLTGVFPADLFAAGTMPVVWTPGIDPRLGPAGIDAGAGNAWVWVVGEFYAAIEPSGAVRVISETLNNRQVVIVDRVGVTGFASCCIAAVKVTVPA